MNERNKTSFLYQLLRPEFVSSYQKPLCCDAFSKSITETPLHKEHNREVKDATLFLFHRVIPDFSRSLLSILAKNDGDLLSFRLTTLMHNSGINIRHTFRVLECIHDRKAQNGITDSEKRLMDDAMTLLLCEMVSRVIKLYIRKNFRKRMKELQTPVEEPYLSLLTDMLNIVFGNNHLSEKAWSTTITKKLISKFCRHIDGSKITSFWFLTQLREKLSSPWRIADKVSLPIHFVFLRLQTQLGCSFSSRIEESYKKILFSSTQPFDIFDIVDIGIRVKHMNIVSHALGVAHLTKGLMQRALDQSAAINLLSTSIQHFENALSSNTSSKVTLRKCAHAYLSLGLEYGLISRRKKEFTRELDQKKICFERASVYFLRAIQLDPQDSESLFDYALFLDKVGEKAKAEIFYKSALVSNPNHVQCRKCFGDLLAESNRQKEAEEQYERAKMASSSIQQSSFKLIL